ncbi:MAG: hypothetical protein N2C12_04790 [Planctomycetales bacterium]
MKLRIRDNSIRLRLTRGEVDSLRADGLVKARTEFPAGHEFGYELESSPASVQPDASFSDRVITVRVPEAMALAWALTEQVSMEGEQFLDDGGKLTILVEKDFTCLAPREGEDESDMFPNPQADSGKG